MHDFLALHTHPQLALQFALQHIPDHQSVKACSLDQYACSLGVIEFGLNPAASAHLLPMHGPIARPTLPEPPPRHAFLQPPNHGLQCSHMANDLWDHHLSPVVLGKGLDEQCEFLMRLVEVGLHVFDFAHNCRQLLAGGAASYELLLGLCQTVVQLSPHLLRPMGTTAAYSF